MRRRIAASAAAIALIAAAAAGCGGGSSSDAGSTTAAATAATAPATSSTAPATTTPAVTIGAEHLPAQDAIPGLKPAPAQQLATAQEFVNVLYQATDPSKPAAVKRLESGGFAGATLRDQMGADPHSGLALFRSYAVALRDHAAAQAEVDAAADEVKAQTVAPTTDIPITDLPGARGLHVEVDQGGIKGKVSFVTFAAGPYVYGLQGVSTNDAALPEDEIIGAARDLYEKVTAAP